MRLGIGTVDKHRNHEEREALAAANKTTSTLSSKRESSGGAGLSVDPDAADVKQLIVELGKRPNHLFFERLGVTLRSVDIAWVDHFCDLGAIAMMVVPLVDRLETAWLYEGDVRYILSIVNVLISIMSLDTGFRATLNCRETPKGLLMVLARPEIESQIKKKIVRVLTFGCVLNDKAYSLVLNSIRESGLATFANPASVPRFLFLLTEIDETRDLEYKALLVGFLHGTSALLSPSSC